MVNQLRERRKERQNVRERRRGSADLQNNENTEEQIEGKGNERVKRLAREGDDVKSKGYNDRERDREKEVNTQSKEVAL